jgi:hypothetical protein
VIVSAKVLTNPASPDRWQPVEGRPSDASNSGKSALLKLQRPWWPNLQGPQDCVDPAGRLLFNVSAMVAELESDLIRLRTRKGIKVAKAKGRVRASRPN